MADDHVYTIAELQDLQNGILHYYSPELGLSGPLFINNSWVGPSRLFSAKNRGGFFELLKKATSIKAAKLKDVTPQDIRKAYEELEEKIKTAPESTEFKGAEEPQVSKNTLTPEQIKAIEESERKNTEAQEVRQKSDNEVREAIKKRQELHSQEIAKVKAIQEKLKTTQAKIYIKTEIPQPPQDSIIEETKTQARDHPKVFFETTAGQIKHNPALANMSEGEIDFVSKQAALTVYDTFVGKSPLIETAILQNIANDPRTPEELKEPINILIEQKLAQYELAKQLYPELNKVDGIIKIEDIKVSNSSSPQDGYVEFDFNKQVTTPYVNYLENQNNFLSDIKGLSIDEFKPRLILHVGKVLDSQIAKLPVESFISRSWNADIVKVGLSRIGLIEAPNIVAAEGSLLGKAIIATGYGNVANFIQLKTGINLGVKLAAKAAVSTGAKVAVGGAIEGTTGVGLAAAITGLFAWTGPLAPIIGAVGAFLIEVVGAKIVSWVNSKIPWGKIKRFIPYVLGIGSFFAIANFFGPIAGVVGGVGVFGLSAGFGGESLAAGITGALTINIIGTTYKIAKPLLIGFASTIAFVVLVLFIINSGAYVTPQSLSSALMGADNPYMLVTKTANPTKLDNSGSKNISYTISVTALKGPLTNLKIVSTDCKIIKKEGGESNCPPESIPSIDSSLSVSPSVPYTLDFSAQYPSNIKDSLIYDSITISADTDEKKGVVTTGSASVCVGDCAVKCVKVSDIAQQWPGNLRSNVERAVLNIGSKYPKFIAHVCQKPQDVNLCYDPGKIGAGFYAWHIHSRDSNHCDVVFNNKGVGNVTDATFLVTHEITHHIQSIDGLSLVNYVASGAYHELNGNGFCSYKSTAGSDVEAMAEADGLYASIPSWGSCVKNYKTQYPVNYNFAKNFME